MKDILERSAIFVFCRRRHQESSTLNMTKVRTEREQRTAHSMHSIHGC